MFNDSKERIERIPLRRALFYVLLSVLVIWGTLIVTWLVHRSILIQRRNDSRYKIVAIVQARSQDKISYNHLSCNHLSCNQLAELLELSVDKPQNLYSFDTSLATQKLLACPAIKRASVHRQKPGIVHVDYSMRQPRAFLADFVNVTIDEEARAFPLIPYYTPKSLPEIRSGLQSLSYDRAYKTVEVELALSIVDYIEVHFPKSVRLVSVDTQHAQNASAGKREVVVVLQDQLSKQTHMLRLSSHHCEIDLNHYLAMKPTLDAKEAAKELCVDLRIPHIAIMKPL